MTTDPNIIPCGCCEDGLQPPALAVDRITCGYSASKTANNFSNDPLTYLHADVINQMRFNRRGDPFLTNFSHELERYRTCGVDFGMWFEKKITGTDCSRIYSYEFNYEDSCGLTSPPCCSGQFLDASGSIDWLERDRTCVASTVFSDWYITFDAIGTVVPVQESRPIVGLTNDVLFVGTVDNDTYTAEDPYVLSIGFARKTVYCFGGSPWTGTATETYVMSALSTPIGIKETMEYETAYTEADGGFCNSSQTTDVGVDTPDPYRLRFTFTPQNAAPNPNHCRVIAKLYFRPYTWGTGWGTETEFETIDFKWKPGDAPYFHEAEYPSFGVFRLGIVSVYLAGKGIPERYEFTP